MAMGAMLALRDIGRKVPRDVAVIGYDDTDLAESMRPSLTTVHQPREELSLATCAHLLELIRLSRGAGDAPERADHRAGPAPDRAGVEQWIRMPSVSVHDSTMATLERRTQ